MKKHNNKILLILFFLLLAAFVLTKVFRSPALESNLDTDVFRIDTANISAIKFQQTGKGPKEITLKKNDSSWIVQQDEKTARVEREELRKLLGTISNIRPERIVSRKEEKWNDYQVDDTTAIRLMAYNEGSDEIANWRIGKESGGHTFMRAADENEIYALEGSLRNQFDKNFNEWRDKSFLRVKKTSVNKITFLYPADSGFVLEKNADTWMIDKEKADSAKVENYLNKLQSIDINDFASGFSPADDPVITLVLDGGSMQPTTVKAWKDPGNKWILSSTFQKGVYFSDSTISRDLFTGKSSFLVK